MTYFYDPATSAVTGNGFFRLDFFTTAPDVRNISPLNYDLHCIFAIIGFVGAEMMGLIRCRFRPFNDNGIQNDFQLSYIMPICPGYDERERDATLFHQQMTFASFFFPYPSGSDQPSPGPKALCSWRHQYFAITRICPPFHRIPPTRLAIRPKIPRPFPTGESRHGWNWGYHTPLWGEPSIEPRCAEHKQYLQIPCDNPKAFCHRLFSGYKICSGPWSVAVSEAPHAAKKHRKQPMTATWTCTPPSGFF